MVVSYIIPTDGSQFRPAQLGSEHADFWPAIAINALWTVKVNQVLYNLDIE